MWALISLCAIDLLFAFTLSFVWNRMYTLFFTVHITGVTVLFGNIQALSCHFAIYISCSGPLHL
ncbi:hypothetical protein F5148DRAFT_135941 [Russula earlei]|uniref:Uncharacterized protein n=1 Tax=Russula earlei TaxID=71964 RepID=A0ACC0TRN5_9AGAM|nr:hypothetical protein F5148DRAFT_135941 [Russula earlei]